MKFKVHHKENRYLALLLIASLSMYGAFFGVLFTGISNPGFLPLAFTLCFYAVIIVFAIFFLSLLLVGHLKGNAIKISAKQFPDIYEVLKSHSQALGLRRIPDMYLLQGGGMLNAFAMRFAQRNFVVLYSDILEVAYQEGMDAVSFIIGHELGHIKRNHVGFMKSGLLLPGKLIPFLGNAYSRACEYTCDNIGYALSAQGAEKGLLVLAAGKRLYKKVNVAELTIVDHNPGFALWFAEIFSTHPALVKRVASINRLNRNNLTIDTPVFTSPRIDISGVEKQQ